MTDATGLFEHASHTTPNCAEGYCTDDNARALLLTVLLEQLGQGSGQVHRLATIYAAFLNYAFDPARGRFRNFMGYDRRWLEAIGSDDSYGRALMALGACVSRSRRRDAVKRGVRCGPRISHPILPDPRLDFVQALAHGAMAPAFQVDRD